MQSKQTAEFNQDQDSEHQAARAAAPEEATASNAAQQALLTGQVPPEQDAVLASRAQDARRREERPGVAGKPVRKLDVEGATQTV